MSFLLEIYGQTDDNAEICEHIHTYNTHVFYLYIDIHISTYLFVIMLILCFCIIHNTFFINPISKHLGCDIKTIIFFSNTRYISSVEKIRTSNQSNVHMIQ